MCCRHNFFFQNFHGLKIFATREGLTVVHWKNIAIFIQKYRWDFLKTSILFPPPCKINNARHRHIGKQKMISRLILSNSSRRIPRLVSRCLSVDVKDFANGPDYLKAELDSNCQEPDWQKISQNLIGKFRSSSEYSRQERLYPKHIDHFIVIFARDYDIVILLKFV